MNPRYLSTKSAGLGLVLLVALAWTATLRAAELPDFSALVRSNAAAVVNISTTQEVSQAYTQHFSIPELPNLPQNSPFNEFFKHFFGGHSGVPQHERVHSLGSGFIISPDGYVLTNAHVIRGAESIVVRLPDRREFNAKLVGSDERTDVALLKIDAKDLPTLKLGDSSHLEVGQWVLAIGSPFGLDHTATQGIVSAVGRSLPGEAYVPFIQTDVALNPGNSGGPLFDTEGRVVGINSQIYSKTGGYMGLSFAVPIDVAMDVVQQIKLHGHVSHGWLGVAIQSVSQDLAESFGLDRPRGALVAEVTPGSPAAKAGIRAGDIILSYDGNEVDDSGALPPLVGSTKVGTQVLVTVLRNGQKKQMQVTIAELTRQAETGSQGTLESGGLNMLVEEPTPEQRSQLGVAEGGVLVQKVAPGAAAAAGLRQGDLILSVNGREVTGVSQFAGLVRQLPRGKPVPVLIQRGHNTLFLALRMPAGKD